MVLGDLRDLSRCEALKLSIPPVYKELSRLDLVVHVRLSESSIPTLAV